MKGKLIRPALVGLVIVGALLVAGGIAYATIPDSSGVIHACYQVNGQGMVDGSGTMRVIDPSSTNKDGSTCKHDEKALDFNQKGPQGDPGPPGPSDVWSVDGYDAGFANLAPAQTWVTLATTSMLPQGSYFVQAEAEADSIPSFSTKYSCDLVDSSTTEYQSARATSSDWVIIPVQAVVTLKNADTISLRCIADVLGSSAFNWQLAAIKVGTVH
jgi:hypothetical protein